MSRLISIALVSLIGLLVGCQTPAARTVQNFCTPPESWTDLEGNEVLLEVEQCHLDLVGDKAFLDLTAFGSVSAIVDVAFTGGDPRGIAGLTIWDSAAEGDFYCLAVRPSGEWRVYRSSDPGQAVGGRGWQRGSRQSPSGFVRLGAATRGGAVQFYVDGKPVDRYPFQEPDVVADVDPQEGRFFVGIFSRQAATRWKNFIAGEPLGGRSFRPEEEEFWGDDIDARELLDRATLAAKSFTSRPSRMRIYPVIASLDEARMIFDVLKDPTGAATVEQRSAELARYLRPGAERIGEDEFLDRAFSSLSVGSAGGSTARGQGFLEKARAAEAAGSTGVALCLYLAAAESGAEPRPQESIDKLKRSLGELKLDFDLSTRAERPIFDARDFWNAARETYGGLRLSPDGELKLHVEVRNSANDAESSKAQRRVPVYLKGQGRLAELLEERDQLESRLPDDLLDARTRANVIRTSAKILGPSVSADLRPYRLGGKTYDLAPGDGKNLVADYKRLDELESLIREEERHESVTYKEIPATLHTNSIIVEFSVLVELGGQELMKINRARSYLGIEQWAHPASRELGVSASRYRQEVVDDAVRSVKDRALRRFRAAISIETILSKLEPTERVAFLIRFTRATDLAEARASLEWFLQEELGIKGQLRRGVVEGCLE